MKEISAGLRHCGNSDSEQFLLAGVRMSPRSSEEVENGPMTDKKSTQSGVNATPPPRDFYKR